MRRAIRFLGTVSLLRGNPRRVRAGIQFSTQHQSASGLAPDGAGPAVTITEMTGHDTETANHNQPQCAVTIDRNGRSRCRNERSRWAEIPISASQLKAALPELKAINDDFGHATDNLRQYELDMRFHDGLRRGCGNARLLKLLETQWTQARRFDGAHRRGTADRDGSCREHAEILRAIEGDRIGAAAEVLIAHWRRGEDVVIAWLEANP